ncbi:MAG: asparagine synthase (glutamine-hydrolyzing), partial [Candidatus Omnitrophota bacterium]
MCGITGYYHYKPLGTRTDDKIIEAMTSSLEHRGPDAEGFHKEDSITLGHRRLKVIDLEGGAQPMLSANKRHALTYNGEIYNFEDIRAALEKNKRVFKTRSDTESLLQALETQWTDCLPHLEGMFAFACFDKKENKLLLAVDPYGKKPLYYSLQDGVIIFASEPKALLKHPLVPKSVDEEAIALYMAFEYVPAPKTIYAGISKLEGGTYLEIKNGEVNIQRYDNFPDEAEVHNTEGAWKAKLTEGLRSAVRKRLVSDVPLGVFLSGGLDSSAILASVRSLNPSQKIKTFTIGFDETSFDESHYARRVSEHFSTEHIEEKLTIQDMLNQHENILGTLDEPLADASYIPTFLLCKLVRQHVTVALAGDGGDEVFCGYPTFTAERL